MRTGSGELGEGVSLGRPVADAGRWGGSMNCGRLPPLLAPTRMMIHPATQSHLARGGHHVQLGRTVLPWANAWGGSPTVG